MSRDVRNPLLFECAWEVANKVGGIYTVIKTKVPVTVSEYGDRYCLIGPLSYKTAPMEVEAEEPTDPHLAATLESMRAQGVKALYGRWLIEGAPHVLLFDTGSQYARLDEWKGDLWNLAGIPSPPNDHETNETIVFGYLVAWFLGDYVARQLHTAVVAHFHEWQAGLAIPLCRKRHIDVTTVFTTHATLLGRYLCAGSVDFYNNLQYFDVDHEAGKRGIYHRYCIERSATHCADVFTTVSHITAYEAEHLLSASQTALSRMASTSAMHEFQNLHSTSKAKIDECSPAGRYEYRNKGVDMFIEALARLNYRLQKAGSAVTVVAFIIMPAQTHSYTVEALKGQAVTKQLRDNPTPPAPLPTPSALLADDDLVLLKRRIFALKRNHSLPPITTPTTWPTTAKRPDPQPDPARKVVQCEQRSIVFHPDFLNSSNPILGLDYEEFVRGTHLGVFPSYYEPWGYTPAECTVHHHQPSPVSAAFMQDLIERPQDEGCYISVEDSVAQLTSTCSRSAARTRRQRINQAQTANLGIEYSKSRQLALRARVPRRVRGNYLGRSVLGLCRASVLRRARGSRGWRRPGDIGTLTEESLETSDYRGYNWPGAHEDEEELISVVRSRAGSVMSGASTPGGGTFRSLSGGRPAEGRCSAEPGRKMRGGENAGVAMVVVVPKMLEDEDARGRKRREGEKERAMRCSRSHAYIMGGALANGRFLSTT
ncbi:glycogen synthase [Mycena rebaudengoi]|nr:glycogen synthase [Mycena rebaudengoi]